jgi:hypothetical protein
MRVAGYGLRVKSGNKDSSNAGHATRNPQLDKVSGYKRLTIQVGKYDKIFVGMRYAQ